MDRATEFAYSWLLIVMMVVAGTCIAAIVLCIIKAFTLSPGVTLLCLGVVVIVLITAWAFAKVRSSSI